MSTKETIVNRLNEIKEEINQLNIERQRLENILKDMDTDVNTKNHLNKINDITKDNSIRIHLEKQTRTTPIMDNFFFSDKEYLVFDNAFFLESRLTPVSLVITRARRDVKYIDNGLTMTDLKQNVNKYIYKKYALMGLDKEARKYQLIVELVKASEKLMLQIT